METITPHARIAANISSGPQGCEYDAIADRIAHDNPGRVLDWGAGFGQVTARLDMRDVDVTAYDFRPGEPAGSAAFDHFPRLRYDHSTDHVRLPYEDRSFDAVLSLGVLEHVSDPDGSLEEIRRVLVPGGRLYVFKLPNRSSYLEWIARRIGWDYHGVRPDDRLYTLSSGRSLLEAHGFIVREAALTNMLPLTVTGTRPRLTRAIWRANTALARIPGVHRLATNVELVADMR